MILIITNKVDVHADYVIDILRTDQARYERWNTEDFPLCNYCEIAFGTSGFISATIRTKGGNRINLAEVRSVWYRRPLPAYLGEVLSNPVHRDFSEQECKEVKTALWELIDHCLWVNHPERNRVANNKPYQLKVARKVGFTIPITLITNCPKAVREFFLSCDGEIVYKRLRSSMIEYQDRVDVVYTRKITEKDLESLPALQYAPGIFQEYVPKDVELRVTVVGNTVFAAEIYSQESERAKHDWRRDFENTVFRRHQLPKNVEEQCLRLVKLLDLQFGAIDLVLRPDGQYTFLEINPNGQWLWIENLTKMKIGRCLAHLLCSDR